MKRKVSQPLIRARKFIQHLRLGQFPRGDHGFYDEKVAGHLSEMTDCLRGILKMIDEPEGKYQVKIPQ